jgi:uncharacterized membrane protein YgcG
MKCPACGTSFSTPVDECPLCLLSLLRLDAKFGAIPRHSRYLTDRSRSLSLPAIKKLRNFLQIFQKKFPQSLFSVLVTDHVHKGTIAEYTFWLANRARFSPLDAVAENNFDLLLGIDVETGTAALTIGYALENYLTEDDLQSALAIAQEAFGAGDILRGIQDCVICVTNCMRESAKTHAVDQSVGNLTAEPAMSR